jgi:ubiquinone/menaquinone biosynthesis C-methylase UbiE
MKLHPMSADLNHDDMASLQFFLAIRRGVFGDMQQKVRTAYEKRATPAFEKATGHAPATRLEARDALDQDEYHKFWSLLRRDSQDLLWLYAGTAIERQYDAMRDRFAAAQATPKGSLTLDPTIKIPKYISQIDTHRMPGSFTGELEADDLRAGALYDLGGAVYQMAIGAKNGMFLNDGRGHTLAAYIRTFYPDRKPQRILDMGSGVGQNTLPLCDYFPYAEIVAIDVGAPMLRYGHARAEMMGKKIHFMQDNAEHTKFPDGSFDLVISGIVLHETSGPAVKNIIAETYRLLAPGGLMVHVENPIRFKDMTVLEQALASWEQYNNDEPFLVGIGETDFTAIATGAGFTDVKEEYVKVVADAFTQKAEVVGPPKGFGTCWYMIAGVKPR